MKRLEINDLHFSYESSSEVLEGMTLTFNQDSTAIVGQNGAGKSTFVKLLKGLLTPVAGEIRFKGQDTKELTAAQIAQDIGLVFQNPNDQIFKNTIIDEVMFGPLNIGQTEAEARTNALAALKKVNLEVDFDATNPYDLSLSERKMISIASILAMDTEVVIFDEPTMGQDYFGKETLKEIIAELEEQGKLVICILHDMDFAAEVFDRIIVFNQGKVLADGAPRAVFSERDILEQAHLEQPYLTMMAQELGIEGVYLKDEELVAAMKNRKN